MSLLEALINVSEKAANIARLCRQEQHLFELLVEEKSSSESNPRFVQDFKTLADVLIQETVKYDIGLQFPELKESIKGEEDNVFCNTIGEKIVVQIQPDVTSTANLLQTVLNGADVAARLLAEEVHRNISLKEIDVYLDNIPKDVALDYGQLGIWIDPIDSTAEYIHAKEVVGVSGICVNGLKCVTVLIGVFDKLTGIPVMGVVNQPFFKPVDNSQWKVAQITMIPKAVKNLNSVESYRPISLFPVLSNLFKKLLLKRLKPILEEKELIPNHQFGFRSPHSTTEQVHRIINKINNDLESNK